MLERTNVNYGAINNEESDPSQGHEVQMRADVLGKERSCLRDTAIGAGVGFIAGAVCVGGPVTAAVVSAGQGGVWTATFFGPAVSGTIFGGIIGGCHANQENKKRKKR